MNEYQYRATRIMQRIDELAAISDDKHCLSRIFGSPSFIKASEVVLQWMRDAGLQTGIDNIGNVRGRLLSENTNAKTLVIASHIDTVINAGKFDGPLGVIMAIDLVEHLTATKTQLPFHLEIIAFSDEEGCRFHTTYLGSKVVAGSFDIDTLKKRDSDNITVEEAIKAMGHDIKKLQGDSITPGNWLGYFEIHIEQGPVLYEKEIPVAVVHSIAGQRRSEIIFKGVAGHAGTVPMNMRNDALCCAAEFILATEQLPAKRNNQLVATVGRLNIAHAATNVIPGEVSCSLDMRSADENVLAAAYEEIQSICKNICIKRNISYEWKLVQETKPVYCDTGMKDYLSTSIGEAGYEVITLVSGAGHDAVVISKVAPVAMLFVRCFKGISHNPLENAELKDIAAATLVCDNFIQQMIAHHNQ